MLLFFVFLIFLKSRLLFLNVVSHYSSKFLSYCKLLIDLDPYIISNEMTGSIGVLRIAKNSVTTGLLREQLSSISLYLS